jgi:hypothetical protein
LAAAETEVKASPYRLRGIGLQTGRNSDVGDAQILAQLMELDSVFQMSQDKMIPMIAFGTPYKVEIPLHEHW